MAIHRGSDMHAAAGHWIKENGAGCNCAADCPTCNHGTLANASNLKDSREVVCIDCGAVYMIDDLVKSGILPSTWAQTSC